MFTADASRVIPYEKNRAVFLPGFYKCLSIEVFAALTISLSIFICEIEQFSKRLSKSPITELRVVAVLSKSKSSALTSNAVAKDTSTGKLNFVFPVSMWLIWVVEIPIRSANSSCDN